MRGAARVRRVARWLGGRFSRKALLLLYHRVAELPSDPQLLAVTPHNFAAQLEVLRRRSRPMSLHGLREALRAGAVPDRAVVITFDDGYADNLHNAKSLLQEQDIPATVFVTASYVGSAREFWWDELERLLLLPGTLPPTLHLTPDGRSYEWGLGEAARYAEEAYGRHRPWHVLLEEDPSPRHQIYRSLFRLLRCLPEEARSNVLDDLRSWAGAQATGRPTHRALSREEVIGLDDGGLVEVGSHTVTHPVLAALPAPAQRAEIHRSKACLESILGHPVTSFAYPFGSLADYTGETVRIIRESGFGCACTTVPEVVRRGADPFQLPRMLARNWTGEEFAGRLEEWFRG